MSDQHPPGSEPEPGADLTVSRPTMPTLSRRTTARVRSGLTLLVLLVLVVVALVVGFTTLTAPVPEPAATPVCTDQDVAEGDRVPPPRVTVSVLNAGTRSGLADRTLSGLTQAGFGEGEQSNAPDDVDIRTVQIWASDRRNPGVRLVRTYLRGRVQIVDRDSGAPGVTVVVGDEFRGVKDGRGAITAGTDSTLCVPTAPVGAPGASATVG